MNTPKVDHNTDNYLGYARFVGLMKRAMPIARPLAYTSEVGEAFRPLAHPYAIRAAYGLSIGYVIVDTCIHIASVHKQTENQSNQMELTIINGTDKAIWHTFASMIFPAITVHTIVKYSALIINKTLHQTPQIMKASSLLSVAIGLCSIPLIIHPLDHLTDYLMDNTIRRFYNDKLVNVNDTENH